MSTLAKDLVCPYCDGSGKIASDELTDKGLDEADKETLKAYHNEVKAELVSELRTQIDATPEIDLRIKLILAKIITKLGKYKR